MRARVFFIVVLLLGIGGGQHAVYAADGTSSKTIEVGARSDMVPMRADEKNDFLSVLSRVISVVPFSSFGLEEALNIHHTVNINSVPNDDLIGDRFVLVNGSVSVWVSAPDNLTVSAESKNPLLIPNENLVVKVFSTYQVLSITPAKDQTGLATIEIQISEETLVSKRINVDVEVGDLSAAKNFLQRQVKRTIGKEWRGKVSYRVEGSVVRSGEEVPATFTDLPDGAYNVVYVSGGPVGNSFYQAKLISTGGSPSSSIKFSSFDLYFVRPTATGDNRSATGALVGHVVSQHDGIAMRDVLIRALQGEEERARGLTDATGSYRIESLEPGNYDLRTVKGDFLTTFRSVDLKGGDSMVVDFSLERRPMQPTIQRVNEQPPKEFASPPETVMARTQETRTETGISEVENITILTHGWIPSWWQNMTELGANGWPASMKEELTKNAKVRTEIIAWDWREDATAWQPGLAIRNTRRQGVALGQVLLDRFGATLNRPLHFVGHSLGTIVNANAANFLRHHGYKSDKIHATLFDEGEIAKLLAPVEYLSGGSAQDEYRPIPNESLWVDSFESSPVGFLASVLRRDEAVHGVLFDLRPSSIIGLNLAQLHGYAAEWYQKTILDPSISPVGFRYSFELNSLTNMPPRGTVFIQALTDEFAFNQFKPTDSFALDISSAYASEAAERAYSFIDRNFVLPLKEIAGAMRAVGQVFTEWIEAKEQSSTFWALQIILKKERPVTLNNARRTAVAGFVQSAYSWIPIKIPDAAAVMSFDFEFANTNSGDYITVGIGPSRLLELQADFISPNVSANSGFADVSKWAGQQVELFVGLFGTNTSPSTVTIKGIRFYPILPPPLMVSRVDNIITIAWPSEAVGFDLEVAEALQGNTRWDKATNTISLTGKMWSITLSASATGRYFRLNHR